ncbi:MULTISPECIES: hypothetical protein [Pseudomonas]|uniref:hypothetical protein n=1 Tax=Pseudomonas TaxID=286 RepID=UPI000A66E6EB|nr:MULTISPECIES: hypothetical protein [Pseudomonas]
MSLLLERLAGLDGVQPTAPGLYFPYQVHDAAAYLVRLEREGGRIIELQVP